MKKSIYYCDECKKELNSIFDKWISIKISGIGTSTKSSTSSILFLDKDGEFDFCDFKCLNKFISKYLC